MFFPKSLADLGTAEVQGRFQGANHKPRAESLKELGVGFKFLPTIEETTFDLCSNQLEAFCKHFGLPIKIKEGPCLKIKYMCQD